MTNRRKDSARDRARWVGGGGGRGEAGKGSVLSIRNREFPN